MYQGQCESLCHSYAGAIDQLLQQGHDLVRNKLRSGNVNISPHRLRIIISCIPELVCCQDFIPITDTSLVVSVNVFSPGEWYTLSYVMCRCVRD